MFNCRAYYLHLFYPSNMFIFHSLLKTSLSKLVFFCICRHQTRVSIFWFLEWCMFTVSRWGNVSNAHWGYLWKNEFVGIPLATEGLVKLHCLGEVLEKFMRISYVLVFQLANWTQLKKKYVELIYSCTLFGNIYYCSYYLNRFILAIDLKSFTIFWIWSCKCHMFLYCRGWTGMLRGGKFYTSCDYC